MDTNVDSGTVYEYRVWCFNPDDLANGWLSLPARAEAIKRVVGDLPGRGAGGVWVLWENEPCRRTGTAWFHEEVFNGLEKRRTQHDIGSN